MKKIVSPLILDLLQIKRISPAEMKVIFACIARNGFKAGHCCTNVIAERSRLSIPTVNRAIDNLIEKGIFIKTSKRSQPRIGKINLPDIENKYSSVILLDQYYEEYEGTIDSICTLTQSIILTQEDQKQFRLVIKDSLKSIFKIPVGLKIRMKCIPIELVENVKVLDLFKAQNMPVFYLSSNVEIL